MSTLFPLAAVDVGNSRIKLGLYDLPTANASANSPSVSFEKIPGTFSSWDPRTGGWEALAAHLDRLAVEPQAWWIGSVQRRASQRFIDLLRERRARSVTLVTSGLLPLAIDVPRPDMVGIDRLLGAVAANRLRSSDRAAIVVALGSAVTVNLIGPDGGFRGGAIFPGIGMSARALHEFTDLLPLVDMESLSEPPPAVGDATLPAMTSGLFWGAVGGVRQLIELYSREIGHDPDVFLTGGAAPSVAALVSSRGRYEPHLVLEGIAWSAAAQS